MARSQHCDCCSSTPIYHTYATLFCFRARARCRREVIDRRRGTRENERTMMLTRRSSRAFCRFGARFSRTKLNPSSGLAERRSRGVGSRWALKADRARAQLLLGMPRFAVVVVCVGCVVRAHVEEARCFWGFYVFPPRVAQLSECSWHVVYDGVYVVEGFWSCNNF